MKEINFDMNKLLSILFLLFMFISCDPKVVNDGRIAYKEYLNKNLKDPASLKIYNESYNLPDGENGIVSEFTIDYGATNSYGAMVRDKITFKIVAGKIDEVNGKYYFENTDIINNKSSYNNHINKTPSFDIDKENSNVNKANEVNKEDKLFGEWVIKQKYNSNKEAYQYYNLFNSDKSSLSFLGNNYISLSDYKKNSHVSFFGKYIIKDSIYYLSKEKNVDGYIEVLNYKENEAEIIFNLNGLTNKYIIVRSSN